MGRKKTSILLIFIITLAVIATTILWRGEHILNALNPLKIKNIDLIHLPENRLRLKLKVTTNRKCKTFIKYWAKNSRDTLYTGISEGTKEHTLWVTNALANTNYTFKVVAFNSSQTAFSRNHPLETQPIYQATPYFSLEYMNKKFSKEMKGKFFLTQILTEPGSAVIIDHKGNIVWYEAFKKGVKVSHWTPDRTVLCIVGSEKIPSSGGDEIVELDLSGKVLTHLQRGKGEMDKMVHHEVRTDENGNIYALTFEKKVFDLSAAGGAKRDTVHGDGIVVFSRKGKKIWQWSVLDHLNPLDDKEILKHKKDWVHANSVFKEKDGNFLISYRDLNQIWKIDYKTGRVIWKLGEKGNFQLNKDDLFSSQHFAHINRKGELMILDNGSKKQITRAMAFKVDTITHTAVTTLNVPLLKDYYTSAKGNAELFNGDKILFCVTDPRALLITDKKGRVLWKVQVGGDPYRIEEIANFLSYNPISNVQGH